MRLTTKGRYAVTAMLDIALHGNASTAVKVSEISGRQRISRSYLERLLAQLHHAGLVESVHGPGGGYQLRKRMQDISVADIIHAIDEPVDATQCRGRRDGEQCMTHELWEKLNLHITAYLSSVTLDALTREEHERRGRVWTPIQAPLDTK